VHAKSINNENYLPLASIRDYTLTTFYVEIKWVLRARNRKDIVVKREVSMKLRRLLMILTVLSVVSLGVFAGGSKEEEVVVAPSGNKVVLDENWSFSWRFVGEEIEFTMTTPTTGWAAIGFNPSRMMKDADYKIGYVSNGEVFMRDDYGTGNTSHGPDTSLGGSENIRIISGVESQGTTTLVFALPKNSGDAYDTVFTPGETYKVLLAYGPNGANNYTAMHRARRSLDITF